MNNIIVLQRYLLENTQDKFGEKIKQKYWLALQIRHYVPKYLLRTIYYSIFKSHIIYGCEVWCQNQNNLCIQGLQQLQKKKEKKELYA